jgi:hypothetical protein
MLGKIDWLFYFMSLVTFVVGSNVGYQIGVKKVQSEAIQENCAEFNTKTGEFQFKK